MALTFTYSGNVYGTGSAGQTTFPLVSTAGNNIPYLLPAHIHAYFSTDNQQTWNELARPGEWDFNDTGTAVVLAAPLPAATELLIRRITPPLDPFVNFQPSSLLTAEQLNEAERFSLYLDQELKDAVDIDSAGSLIYKGLIDLTADNAPLAPQVGWTYYNTGAGTVIQGGTPGWVGITGDAVLGGEQVIYDGTNWTIPDPVFGVQQVTGTAPITVDNTDGQRPVVGITAATTSAAGSMSGADKTKLDGIASGAEVNVQSDWNEADTGSDAFIQNKPTIPDPTNPPASGTFGYWSRTGTVVAPATSTDDINTLGDIAAGGSLGGASLNVNGLEYASVDGTAGQLLTTDGAGTLGWSTVDPPPGTVISDIAPANPEEGQLWWDSVNGQLYVWYEDANSNQWVQANTAAAAFWTRTGTTLSPLTAGDTISTTGTVTGNLLPTNGQLAGFRNLLINGDFRINQRGGQKIPAVVNEYGFDRWRANSATHIEQIIEDAPAGQYTLWCEGGTAALMSANIANVAQLGQGPSNVPLTFNYNGTGNLSIIVPGVVTKVQCEPGPIATPFEHRPIGTELALCQRYCHVAVADGGLNPYMVLGTGRWYDAGNAQIAIQHPVQLRTAPTLESTSPANTFHINLDASLGGASPTALSLNEPGFNVSTITVSYAPLGRPAGTPTTLYCNTGVAKIVFSAEL